MSLCSHSIIFQEIYPSKQGYVPAGKSWGCYHWGSWACNDFVSSFKAKDACVILAKGFRERERPLLAWKPDQWKNLFWGYNYSRVPRAEDLSMCCVGGAMAVATSALYPSSWRWGVAGGCPQAQVWLVGKWDTQSLRGKHPPHWAGFILCFSRKGVPLTTDTSYLMNYLKFFSSAVHTSVMQLISPKET